MDVLEENGIIYEHKTGRGAPFTKLSPEGGRAPFTKLTLELDRGLMAGDNMNMAKCDKVGDKKKTDCDVLKYDNESQHSIQYLESDAKCVDYLKTGLSEIKPEIKTENFFTKPIPVNFELLCLTSLAEYVVRLESVMTSQDFAQRESLTINRQPLCSYVDKS